VIARLLDRHWRLLSLAAGAAAAVAHPPFGVLPGLLGWGLLFLLLTRAEGPRPLRRAFALGWLAAVAYLLIGCWWVAEAFLVDAANQGWMAPIAVTLLPAGIGLFWGAAGVLYRRLRPEPAWAQVLLFAGALSLFEWLRGHVLTGFPWNLPGETWKAGSAPSQAAALMGAYGLTWVTLAIAAALVAPVQHRGRHGWRLFAAGVLAVAGLYACGWVRLAAPAPQDPAAPWIRVVQADVKQEAKYNAENFRDIVERYLRLTAQPAARRPDIVIWPEGALPAAANDLLAAGAWTRDGMVAALQPGQTLMFGAYRVAPGPEKPLYYNSLLVLRREAGDLTLTGVYDKHRLVPFGEYLPLEQVLAPLGVKDLAHIGDGFSPGPPPRPIAPEGVPEVQPLICYESLYPGFARAGARLSGRRPRWIVNISNDAWFGQTSGPWQHLNQASYRAIEEGLPIVRATPTGVSAIIDGYGRVLPGQFEGLGRAGVVDAALPAALSPTPFTLFGELIFWSMISLSFVKPLLTMIIRRRLRRIVSTPT
jgi:apolipoprotein N-acyltransferase